MSHSMQAYLQAAQSLLQTGRPHAVVTVLRVQPPASARPGDRALVTAQGIEWGWIGGGCSQPAVLKTVRRALMDGQSRLIRIAGAEEGQVRELGDVLEFGMACHSGGTLELFVEPVQAVPRLVIVGDSPMAQSLCGLAARVDLAVSVVAHEPQVQRFPDAQQVLSTDDAQAVAQAIPADAFVVVATQGRRDLQGLRAALAVQARRVFFVASARKAQVLKTALLESGAEPQAVAAIEAPAGAYIGAQTPQEIALSVLAAVVAARRGAEVSKLVTALPEATPAPAARAQASSVTDVPGREPVLAESSTPRAPRSCCGG
jgi:xanthine dehydrogenase accessory factor